MKWHRRAGNQILPPSTIDALRTLESHVRPNFTKSVVYGILALAAAITGQSIGGVHDKSLHVRLIAWGCVVLLAIFGVLATRAAAAEVARVSTARAGTSAGAALRIAVLLFGFLITLIAALNMAEIPAGRYLVGGGVTAIVGIAGQQVLGNLLAGLVLLFSRPYIPGERVRILSGALGGPHEGVVTTVGLLYTMVVTADGPLNIPNSALLASAVGPVSEKPTEKPEESEKPKQPADPRDSATDDEPLSGW